MQLLNIAIASSVIAIGACSTAAPKVVQEMSSEYFDFYKEIGLKLTYGNPEIVIYDYKTTDQIDLLNRLKGLNGKTWSQIFLEAAKHYNLHPKQGNNEAVLRAALAYLTGANTKSVVNTWIKSVQEDGGKFSVEERQLLNTFKESVLEKLKVSLKPDAQAAIEHFKFDDEYQKKFEQFVKKH